MTADSENPPLAICSNSSCKGSQLLLSASSDKAEFSEVGAVMVSSCLASHGRPWSQQELYESLKPRATSSGEQMGERADLVSSQGRGDTVLFLNAGDKDERKVEHELTSLWGEALNFPFSGEACLTKYRLLNHMCNKLLQKLPRLQLPAKGEEAAFTDTGLQAQAFLGTLCPLLHFASPFYYFILGLD